MGRGGAPRHSAPPIQVRAGSYRFRLAAHPTVAATKSLKIALTPRGAVEVALINGGPNLRLFASSASDRAQAIDTCRQTRQKNVLRSVDPGKRRQRLVRDLPLTQGRDYDVKVVVGAIFLNARHISFKPTCLHPAFTVKTTLRHYAPCLWLRALDVLNGSLNVVF
ncbi:hypothetical protein NDU88_000684 [Pleurodeles waltl]|uniref:Uncharacterized protein n=1 Tax=Pleurodeles waltl TaxID=8319 RepID=A0AAV7TG84_PLEWA|nr:hypothetical protein NDU88_000684 [Pleurodeles waltl]